MDKQKAMERLFAIEAEAKALRADIDKPEAKEPRWKANPELLVGKLCWVWDNPNNKRVRCCVGYDSFDKYRFETIGQRWLHAEPLTPAEIAAMTYRESRYDWSKVPAKYNWVARDSDKYPGVYAFMDEPRVEGLGVWWLKLGYGKEGGLELDTSIVLDSYGDWRDSLEHRPESI